MKIAFKTFGCRANSVDTDVLYQEAQRRGMEIVPETEKADAYIINSCTVTHGADRDARTQARRFKRLNPNAKVGVIGCYSQVAPQEVAALESVDFVIGSANKERILSLLQNDSPREQVEPATGFLVDHFLGSRNARAPIKIQDGCNFKCSFCIIPTARGRSKSLPMETVLQQIDEAEQLGYEEIVLTGIHLAHYGWDKNTDLMALLNEIFRRPTGPRVRLSTLDPFEIPDELIALFGREQRLCPYLHIALQSGSDDVLSAMRRHYKAIEFEDVTAKIQKACPDMFIGVDVIVGFPGEGKNEFQETVDCLERSFWTKLHVFPFSLRKGTLAQNLSGKVDSKTIKERSQTLRTLSDSRTDAFLDAQIGKTGEVLLEKRSARDPSVWLGHTENYVPIAIRAEGESKQTLPCRLEKRSGSYISASHFC